MSPLFIVPISRKFAGGVAFADGAGGGGVCVNDVFSSFFGGGAGRRDAMKSGRDTVSLMSLSVIAFGPVVVGSAAVTGVAGTGGIIGVMSIASLTACQLP